MTNNTKRNEAKQTAEFEGSQTLAYVQFLTDGSRLLPELLPLALAQLKCRATAAFHAAGLAS